MSVFSYRSEKFFSKSMYLRFLQLILQEEDRFHILLLSFFLLE